MDTHTLGRTARTVSAIGLGTWQLGADWGSVDDADARAVLDASYAAGVTMYDTADVYGDGRSEQRIAAWLDDTGLRGEVFVATKMGRRMDQTVENYSPAHFREWTDRSRANLGVDTLDLVQLHCPPDGVYASDAVFDSLDALVADGTISAYGVSVETVDQALAAIARPGVATVQIILNAFRLKPLDAVLPAAEAAGVGIIARVPLASGLLSGRYDHDTAFAADDHRTYNRDGSAFDVGETFSGVDFDEGVEAAPGVLGPRPRPRPAARDGGPRLAGPAARRQHGHPGCPQRDAGGGQRGRRVGASARGGVHRCRARPVRPPLPRRHPLPLVTAVCPTLLLPRRE